MIEPVENGIYFSGYGIFAADEFAEKFLGKTAEFLKRCNSFQSLDFFFDSFFS